MNLISRLINKSGLRISHSKVFSSEYISYTFPIPSSLKTEGLHYFNIKGLRHKDAKNRGIENFEGVQKIETFEDVASIHVKSELVLSWR